MTTIGREEMKSNPWQNYEIITIYMPVKKFQQLKKMKLTKQTTERKKKMVLLQTTKRIHAKCRENEEKAQSPETEQLRNRTAQKRNSKGKSAGVGGNQNPHRRAAKRPRFFVYFFCSLVTATPLQCWWSTFFQPLFLSINHIKSINYPLPKSHHYLPLPSHTSH